MMLLLKLESAWSLILYLTYEFFDNVDLNNSLFLGKITILWCHFDLLMYHSEDIEQGLIFNAFLYYNANVAIQISWSSFENS